MKELIDYKEIDRQIAEISNVEDANLMRTKINTLIGYVHQVAKDRETKFFYASEGQKKYINTSRLAGELWNSVENKKTQADNQYASQNFAKLSTQDAGFKNSQDATICSRIAELDEQDVEIYFEDCLLNIKMPSLHGLYRIWRMLNENIPIPIEGKYRVIYIDPPWHYGNLMPDYAPMPEVYYEPIKDDDLMDMNIGEIADDNAVMFIWVTSPKLEDCFEIIRYWGFKYKASFVWDKVKHNMGHYNSVRHEFLLLCTKGSCQPDTMKLFDSVQIIERGEHSEKPEEFREIIDTLYPEGNRIEIFARKKVRGWDYYGDEVS